MDHCDPRALPRTLCTIAEQMDLGDLFLESSDVFTRERRDVNK